MVKRKKPAPLKRKPLTRKRSLKVRKKSLGRRKPLARKYRRRVKRKWRKVSKRLAKKLRKRKALPKPPRDWKQAIKVNLERTLARLGVDGRVRVVRNADNSVDGELRVPVPVGVHEHDLMRQLYQASAPLRRTWITVGARYAPDTFVTDEDRERYLKYFGAFEAMLSYWRTGGNPAGFFLDGIGIMDAMRRTYQRKPIEIAYRTHWNIADGKPDRKGR